MIDERYMSFGRSPIVNRMSTDKGSHSQEMLVSLTSAEGPEVLGSQWGNVGVKDHLHPPYRETFDGDVKEDLGKPLVCSEGLDTRRLGIMDCFPLFWVY